MEHLVIYGAKSLALGVCLAVRELYPEHPVTGFLVSSLHNNPSKLAGLPVMELSSFSDTDVHILVATPEDLHREIVTSLEQYGFHRYTCMDSRKEAKLMEQYYSRKNMFPSLHSLRAGKETPVMQAFAAKFYRDRPLQNQEKLPGWVSEVQAGTALTQKRIAEYADNQGDHISAKNVNYCELTALYWIWKNRLSAVGMSEYYGLYHYRRILDIDHEDLLRIKGNDVDAVLPYPTVHEPDIREHHARYIKEEDWQAMLQALEELQPEYAYAFSKIMLQPYLYNYNILVAKGKVLENYCGWLFPILERTEELSIPKGSERADRYIGYLGENLLTLYFMYHKDDLKIVHTGRIMLT